MSRCRNALVALTMPRCRPQPLEAMPRMRATRVGRWAPLRSDRSPLRLLSYAGPVTNDAVTIGFRQSIAASDSLLTGGYGKTLVFTLSTTTP